MLFCSHVWIIFFSHRTRINIRIKGVLDYVETKYKVLCVTLRDDFIF